MVVVRLSLMTMMNAELDIVLENTTLCLPVKIQTSQSSISISSTTAPLPLTWSSGRNTSADLLAGMARENGD